MSVLYYSGIRLVVIVLEGRTMKNISDYVAKNVKSNGTVEVIWDELRFKVIRFDNGDPVSYVALDDTENNFEGALKAASVLINGGGAHLSSMLA